MTTYDPVIFNVWRHMGDGVWRRGKIPTDPKGTPGVPFECSKQPLIVTEHSRRYWEHYGLPAEVPCLVDF